MTRSTATPLWVVFDWHPRDRRMSSRWRAGYADDTAIYLASKQQQAAALAAVNRFSRVSGLKLYVRKCVAIGLCNIHRDESRDSQLGQTDQDLKVRGSRSTRYLGHIADTTKEAWIKAFIGLTIRLSLATVKTNTAQQRAMISAAIIVPKLLYVARHA
ncbi:hypothetical protein JG687_00016617 [Phytophthora cactorum]|uniref:Reverse transcriptase domain-containing protein n=1 Tax=Phytophthora cactorum TaxID=29920 RepID=A0A8T1TQ90_9STRA|nr:hypothetical protein JG687_00016617 [Phytophthora cactorum]